MFLHIINCWVYLQVYFETEKFNRVMRTVTRRSFKVLVLLWTVYVHPVYVHYHWNNTRKTQNLPRAVWEPLGSLWELPSQENSTWDPPSNLLLALPGRHCHTLTWVSLLWSREILSTLGKASQGIKAKCITVTRSSLFHMQLSYTKSITLVLNFKSKNLLKDQVTGHINPS